MDIKKYLGLTAEELENEDLKEQIFEDFLEINDGHKFDKKEYKRLFKLSLKILHFKGEQVISLLSELDTIAAREGEREALGQDESAVKFLKDQIEKQNKILEKNDVERVQFRNKIKELSEEIVILQRRLQESSHLGSENEDSENPLSEIDKQNELMSNISMKNKHIKRLLRDIEDLEARSTKQIDLIKDLRLNLNDSTQNVLSLTNQLKESNGTIEELEQVISNLNHQIEELSEQNKQLCNEKLEREQELEKFSRDFQERIETYQNILYEKQEELNKSNQKYLELMEEVPGYNVDCERNNDFKKLVDSVKERDMIIKNLEEKIAQITNELFDSTNVINQFNGLKENYMKKLLKNKSDQCCKETKIMLEKSNVRCKELQEMLSLVESDNILKAKQAFEAIETLRSYENSEDGFADALKKINKLQESIHQRDKQIHDLVVELNSANEIVAENCILRKKLGIPEDEIISTKTFYAKQRKFAKINERLLLKLRASEEMRLQLKIDKNYLRRKIAHLKNQLANGSSSEPREVDDSLSNSESDDKSSEREISKKSSQPELKMCENCHAYYNIFENVKFCKSCVEKQQLSKKVAESEIEMSNIVEENDNLRIGMREILEKLRDFEGSSEKQTINPSTLEKLLYILKLRHSKNGLDELDTLSNLNNSSGRLSINRQGESEEDIEKLKILIRDLSDKNEELISQIQSMEIVKKQYDEVIANLEMSEDDRDKSFLNSIHRCNEIELNVKSYERKIDYLKTENEQISNELKNLKLENVRVLNELKLELCNRDKVIDSLKLKIPKKDTEDMDDEMELENLNLELQQIKIELNGLCFNILKNIKTIDNENLLNLDVENLNNITLLENDLSSSIMTRQEYMDMKNQIQKLKNEVETHKVNEKSLKEMSKITQAQLMSQQQLIASFSDDEISARHLIVDLQSQSNEKYLFAKVQRELSLAKENEDRLKIQIDQLTKDLTEMKNLLKSKEDLVLEKAEELKALEYNNILKIKYLKKTLLYLCEQFSSLTPALSIIDFVKNYVILLDLKKNYELKLMEINQNNIPELNEETIISKLKENLQIPKSEIENKIAIIKYKSSSEYLKQQLELQKQTVKDLQDELEKLKLNEVQSSQHWNTIKLLFAEEISQKAISPISIKSADISRASSSRKTLSKKSPASEKSLDTEIETCDKAVQVCSEVQTVATNTEEIFSQEAATEFIREKSEEKTITPSISEIEIIPPSPKYSDYQSDSQQKSLESQLKQAMILANTRSVLLIETENRLSETQGRIKVLEKSLEEKDKLLNKAREVEEDHKKDEHKKDDSILSITIATLQNLLLEKDTTLSRYQELLKTERQQHTRAYDDQVEEIKNLKKSYTEWEQKMEESNKSIANLQSKLEELEKKNIETEQVSEIIDTNEIRNQLKIENLELELKNSQKALENLELKLIDCEDKEKLLETDKKERETLIRELTHKLKTANENIDTMSENRVTVTEIDQLREMLEEKDRHIQELTETLNQFHDDQQKFFDDTAINSTEQVTQMNSDLNRAEATNRVMRTQVEALKRQIQNITQREKQARDMIKTLKNQLIRRPVISVKSDKKSPTTREEQQQRKMQQLESEILDLKEELRKQININDNKKAKNAAELGLWDKQKRYQELSEKLKAKLTEREIDFERIKANYTAAKNTIARLEKERAHLDSRIKSGRHYSMNTGPFCPNCHQQHGNKYTTAETPDSYTNTTAANSDAGSLADIGLSENSHEVLNALKSRIESQQRKIIALELEGKGTNATTLEMERLQEKLSTIESQNIRLEARNIQLQLDMDLLKQSDTAERLKRQIKHLEDYILVLKDELSQAHAKLGNLGGSSKNVDTHSHTSVQQMEQTILTLKRVIERLKVENKHLKEKPGSSSQSLHQSKKEEHFDKLKAEFDKLQKAYNDALDKISGLQVELEVQANVTMSCPHCNNKNMLEMGIDENTDLPTQLSIIKEQLQQKSQLLEKAKLMLTRAAAKERQLREQIAYFKRRCCELQNIPVIEEISE